MSYKKKVIEDGVEYNVRVYSEGDTFWYNSTHQAHRENGPAITYGSGHQYWYLNDKLVYGEFEDNTCDFEITDKMKLSIIKYKLSRE